MKQIKVNGYIVQNEDKWIYDFLGYPSVSPDDISAELTVAGEDDVEVLIDSYGGSVWAGSAIYTMLNSRRNVTSKIIGLAASAASVIAMAGRTLMSPTAQMMIHPASSYAGGDYRDHAHESNVLKVVDASIRSAYKLKSGMDDETLKKYMDAETWLTADKALELKLIDEIMFVDERLPDIRNALAGPSRDAIEKIRATIKPPAAQTPPCNPPESEGSLIPENGIAYQDYTAKTIELKGRI